LYTDTFCTKITKINVSGVCVSFPILLGDHDNADVLCIGQLCLIIVVVAVQLWR